MFSISYYDSVSAPVTTISTWGYLHFDSTIYFLGDLFFDTAQDSYTKVYGNVDFTSADVIGLDGGTTTAVFG